jgi:hypothetical protein
LTLLTTLAVLGVDDISPQLGCCQIKYIDSGDRDIDLPEVFFKRTTPDIWW